MPATRAAALYHRVSTLDQDRTLARRELRAAARSRGYTVALDVEETGSGRRNDRPGLQKVMQAARAGSIVAVLVWKLDRFGRSTIDVLANVRALGDAGVRFIATSQGIDVRPGGDATSQLTLTVLAGVAEFERELIVERTHAGLDGARRRGVKLGRRRHDAASPAVVRELQAQGLDAAAIADVLGAGLATIYRRMADPDDTNAALAQLDGQLKGARAAYNAGVRAGVLAPRGRRSQKG